MTVYLIADQSITLCETGEEISRTTYSYDEDWNLTEEISYQDSEESSRYTYSYDDGKMTQSVYSHPDGVPLPITASYSYDANGNPVEKVEFINGTENQHTTYTHDANGSTTETVGRYSDGEQYTRYSFDANGNMTEVLCLHDGEEYYNYTYTYSYDILGNITEQVCFSRGKETKRYTYRYSYDINGDITEEVCFRDGEESYRYAYFYDAQGNLTEKTYSFANGDSEHYSYTYDENESSLIVNINYNKDENNYRQTLKYVTVKLSKEEAKQLTGEHFDHRAYAFTSKSLKRALVDYLRSQNW